MHYDFIIVGAGIAGSILAHELENRNQSFVIIHNPHKRISSEIAAGLYNPIVFKRFTQSWKADIIIPVLDDFYSQLEKKLGGKFHKKIDILKVFTNDDEKALWQKKAKESSNIQFMDEHIYESIEPNYFQQFSGFGKVKQSGFVDMSQFLQLSDNYFFQKSKILEFDFDYSHLKIDKSIRFNDISADHIIFCEGWHTSKNPFFPNINFKLTKGEILTIRADTPDFNFVMNKNAFLLPLGDGLFKLGATYEWENLNENISQKGLDFLLDKARAFIKFDFELIDHSAGIRPTVIDRRPLIGSHHKFSNLHIFNGMGTKGIILAPYFSKQLINQILDGKTIDDDVNINRFIK